MTKAALVLALLSPALLCGGAVARAKSPRATGACHKEQTTAIFGQSVYGVLCNEGGGCACSADACPAKHGTGGPAVSPNAASPPDFKHVSCVAAPPWRVYSLKQGSRWTGRTHKRDMSKP